jgi:3',5'-cyclic-AMP phosphodiesterase
VGKTVDAEKIAFDTPDIPPRRARMKKVREKGLVSLLRTLPREKILIGLCTLLWMLLWMLLPGGLLSPAAAQEKAYYGVALIGDPHLPGKDLPAKISALRTIDGWPDIDRVVVLGDICKESGTSEEYAAAKTFFDRLRKPTRFVAGNHDYIYSDEKNTLGMRVKALRDFRRVKLERFVETFGLSGVYDLERLGGYLMIYLSTDDLESAHLTQISDSQLDWLQKRLTENKTVPTLIFFHAPLAGTLHNYNEQANTPSFIAQPTGRLHNLILENPQIFLWISGHMHVPATSESFSAPVNLYGGRVMNIHNPDMERKTIWTNVLRLYPDRVVIRTWDHAKGDGLEGLERTIRPYDQKAR